MIKKAILKNTIKIKILKSITYKNKNLLGKIIKIEVDCNNTPLEKFWRDKFRDCKMDNCFEVVKSRNNNGEE